ncbi:hypothetical protein RvY_06633 [Ramazzottius varieornatus]|uniref:Reverse transcriptase domain-containing protein n=1 Tax=Ramazzottius varieornatus TaxID=947166 RepID=A0A1D1V2M6_RAMVA|nr:hypothetical protein RvY_06633 [Ramazzottius varieornatus]
MLDGNVPEDVCPALYGASLIALLKKTEGIRPIAIGNTLRRLGGKIVSKRVMEATVALQWYFDDATLGGDFELVSRDFQTIVEIGASLGLELNTSKCEFVVCGGAPTQQQVTRQKMKLLCPGVIFPDKETLTILGAPVFPEAIPPVLEKKIQQAELMTTRLQNISAYQALFLLKNCLSLPKLLYILRRSPTFSCLPSLQAFDETIRKCAGKIANIAMDDTVWRQSSLPVSRGVLGIRRVDELALPAFLASVHSAFDLMKQIYPQVDVNSTASDKPLAGRKFRTASHSHSPISAEGLSVRRHSRHSALNDSLHRALISCKVPNVLEPNGILRDDQKRPDGLTLIPWQQGKALVWDVTCVDTLAETYLRGSAGQLGYAANKAEELKRHKYRELDGRYLFCPVAFETFGPFGNEASSLIQQIGKRIAEATGETRSLSFLKQKLSTDIQRGKAASVFGTFSSHRGLEEIYYIVDVNNRDF